MFIIPRYLPILEKYSSLHAVTKEELYESILEFKNDELVSHYIGKTDFQECLLNCLCILADERRIVGKQAAKSILGMIHHFLAKYNARYNDNILLRHKEMYVFVYLIIDFIEYYLMINWVYQDQQEQLRVIEDFIQQCRCNNDK